MLRNSPKILLILLLLLYPALSQAVVSPPPQRMVVNVQSGTTYTVLSSDRGKLVTFSNAASVAVTLPQAGSTFPSGWYVDLQNRGAGTVTVTPATSTIDGTTSIVLTTDTGIRLASNGTNYFTQRGISSSISTWPSSSAVKEITWANSIANAARIGDGANPVCLYTDASLGARVRPCTAGNISTVILTNFNYNIYDEEGAVNLAVVDPDAFATGSGTLTMQTSEQLVASNFGLEFNESDTNPPCAAGNYNIYADTSETALKKCVNGTASVLASGGATIVRKTADETVNNSSARQNDDHLLFAVDASSQYTFDVLVMYSSATAADFNMEFTGPASYAGRWQIVALPSSATACGGNVTGDNINISGGTDNSIGGVGVGTVCSFTITGMVTTAGTAGTITMKWAQTAATASDTVVYTNSYLRWQKL